MYNRGYGRIADGAYIPAPAQVDVIGMAHEALLGDASSEIPPDLETMYVYVTLGLSLRSDLCELMAKLAMPTTLPRSDCHWRRAY